MEDYKLKRQFVDATEVPATSADLAGILRSGEGLLPWDDVRRYAEVDPGNARLRQLADETVGAGAWRLLWLPPSLPYYALSGRFADPELAGFTKRLVFSSWRWCPRAIATMLSYEAERTSWSPKGQAQRREHRRSPQERDRRAQLRFTEVGRLTGHARARTRSTRACTSLGACDPSWPIPPGSATSPRMAVPHPR